MQTVFPSEAIQEANAATVKYQLSHDSVPDQAVAEYLQDIKPVLDMLGPKADQYIQKINGALKMKLHITAMPEDNLPDKLTDPLNQRAVTFLGALLEALSKPLP